MYVKTDGANNLVKDNYTLGGDFRADYPNTHLSSVESQKLQSLADRDIYPVTILDKPAYDPATQILDFDQTSVYNGATSRWERGWTVRAMTAQEITARAKRIYEQTVDQAGASYTENDKLALLATFVEVQRYRLAALVGEQNNVLTPLIDAFQTVFPGQTKAQIATTIESRIEPFLVTAATAYAEKVKDGA